MVVRSIVPPAFRTRRSPDQPVRLGFVPLTDSAPLVVARELGFFARRGLRVALSRELGWATVRDKLVQGELDAAHAPCALPFVLHLGLGCVPTACVTSLVLNLHGNAITLSTALRDEGVTDLISLGDFVRDQRRSRTLVFGVVSLHSTHTWLLRTWLARAAIKADKDVRIVVVPPPQMSPNLRAGNLDGFCVGEPWNSVAIAQGDGWCAATSCELAPGHPEKVLALRGDFAHDNAGRHLALTEALLEACLVCADPAHRHTVLRLLSRREYLGLPVDQLAPALTGRFPLGHGRYEDLPDFTLFSRDDSNDPTTDKAGWVVQHILEPSARALLPPLELGRIFRSDLFTAARDRLSSLSPHEAPSEACILTA